MIRWRSATSQTPPSRPLPLLRSERSWTICSAAATRSSASPKIPEPQSPAAAPDRLFVGSQATGTGCARDLVVVQADPRGVAGDVELRQRALQGRSVLLAVGVRGTRRAAGPAARCVDA